MEGQQLPAGNLSNYPITLYAHTNSNYPFFFNYSWRLSGCLPAGCLSEDRVHIAQHDQVFCMINLSSGNFVVLSSCDNVYVTRNHCSCVGNFWLSTIFRKLQVVMECMEGGELFDRISIKVWLLKYSESKIVLSKFRFSRKSLFDKIWHLDNKFPIGCFHWKGSGVDHEGNMLGS